MLVRLLGALEVEVAGEQVALPPGKPRSLFAWLAVHRGLHARRELAGRFWPEVLDSSARASLRSALWALRSSLGPTGSQLEATREQVGLAAEVRTISESSGGGSRPEIGPAPSISVVADCSATSTTNGCSRRASSTSAR